MIISAKKYTTMSININEACDRTSPAYTAYAPDQSIVMKIAPLLVNKTITMVIGTWCSDSKKHVPSFYKILDQAKFPDQSIKLIQVDAEKKAIDDRIDNLEIKSVPTFIIFEGKVEIGRIVEQPTITLEQDLLNLFS